MHTLGSISAIASEKNIFLYFPHRTREALRKHVEEFGECLKKDNDVGLIIDGQVLLCKI
jgi:hypothetical protein